MIVTETDAKVIYPEFKYFKNIYTTINIADSVTFFPYDHKIYMIFSKDSPYYILTGSLKQNSIFTKWIRTVNSVTMNLSQINILAKTLKKNAVEISFENENFFKFTYLEKDSGNQTEIILNNDTTFNKEDVINNYINLNFTEEHELSDSFINNEICIIYKNSEGKITSDRTKDKVIEIPSARIRSLIKNGKNKVHICERNILKGSRLIVIESNNDDLNLTLRQVFNTI